MDNDVKLIGLPLRISTITAWVGTDEAGNEGIIGLLTDRGWLPCVGADHTRIESLRQVAVGHAATTGHPVRLIRFSTREVLETVKPE